MSARITEQDFAELIAPRRNRFYYGKRMDVRQFETEQTYHRRQQALINRLSLGMGVLCGLSLRIEGEVVILGPGTAVDGLGREIIVPHSVMIDPWGEEPCCPCCDDAETDRPRPRDAAHTVTIALCYRECLTDQQPAFVDDCAGPDACEAGTVVESYCIRLIDGEPDPRLPSPGCEALREHDPDLDRDARIALRRTRLCELLAADCSTDPDAACVPIASVELLADGTIGAITICPVRPRLYSNETLLELILCLADRIEECCQGDEEPTPDTPFRVAAVRWIATGTDGSATTLDASTIPLIASVPHSGEPREIDIEFTADVDPGPVSPVDDDTPPEAHNVRVTLLENGEVLRGTALVIAPRIIRYRAERGFRPGRYELMLAGTSDAATGLTHLTDTAANALDGEPLGLPSGDNTEGGNFVVEFIVE